MKYASVTVSNQPSSASPVGNAEFDPQTAWENLRDQLYAQYLKSSPLLLSTKSCSDTKLQVSWTAPVTKGGTERMGVRIVRGIRSSMVLPHDKPLIDWQRKRAQEVVAYIVNKLTGVHLTPGEARAIYNRLVASTWPDDGSMKWPPAPKEISLAKLETERRIKE